MRPLAEKDPLDEAPKLGSLHGAPTPFSVPDGFFDRFPHRVQSMAIQRQAAQRPVARLLPWGPKLALAAAAVLVAFLGGRFILSEGAQAPIPTDTYALESDGVMLGWDDPEVLAMVAEIPALAPRVGEGVDDDALATYLEEEDLPFEMIIEEL
ncbi:MAG: hypothetical protein QY325_03695 [Flavobacteriales bacterium]|nr:MAG: hypothetical protein QY325_03695 [Flavobacteriales bacterium]